MKTKKVIVLILSYNGKHLLNDSISSYLANDYTNFEVVVVDNGSVDGSKEYVEANFPSVIVHRTDKNLKYSGGLNFGMTYAFTDKNADYVLITNNDVKVDSKVISSFVTVAESDPMIGFVTGKVYYFDQPDTFQTTGKKFDPVLWNGGHIGHLEKDHGQYDKVVEIAWCDDIYWLVRRELWKLTGGYDTEFAFQGEDFDWQIRAKNVGYRIFYTPFAKLWHKESMTIGKQSPMKAYYDARNPLIIHLKYRNPAQCKIIIRKRLKGMIKAIPKNVYQLKFSLVHKTWQGFFSAMLWGIKNNKLTWRHLL